MPCFSDRGSAGVSGYPAFGIDHCNLADGICRVARDQTGESFRRAPPSSHQVEPQLSVGWIGQRLRRNDTDTGFRPCHYRADREIVRFDGHTDLARRGIARDDRVGVRQR